MVWTRCKVISPTTTADSTFVKVMTVLNMSNSTRAVTGVWTVHQEIWKNYSHEQRVDKKITFARHALMLKRFLVCLRDLYEMPQAQIDIQWYVYISLIYSAWAYIYLKKLLNLHDVRENLGSRTMGETILAILPGLAFGVPMGTCSLKDIRLYTHHW